jgi:hypothetical protein
MFHSFFLSALPLSQNAYQSFCKKQIYFLFFTNFETLFFVSIFHIHFLRPLMKNLTKSHDLKFVLWSSGIQNKVPFFTVYPLYASETNNKLLKNLTHYLL